MRLVSGAPYSSNIQSLYNKLGWQNLHERHQQHTLIIMYKIYTIPQSICNLQITPESFPFVKSAQYLPLLATL